ncbi:MAG: hypothetical protein JXR26_01090 [Balneolaceae bacterium]|nr:hypothetical protein [Balneolaceae bacterium]
MAFLLSLFIFLAFQPAQVFQSDANLQPADSLIARNWTIKDGLPVNAVNEVIQDDDGYIWFTTYDGIVRFDGLNFKVLNRSNTPEMPQNRAVNIHHQKGVGIWVSLENGGLVLISDDGAQYFGEEQDFTRSDVTFMLEDSRGRMWFGTYQGLYKFENNLFSRVLTRDTPSQNRISYIYEAQDRSIWVATFDGLVHLEDGDVEIFDREPATVHNEFTQIISNGEGELWVGSRMGLLVLKNRKLVRPDVFEPLDGEYVTAIYKDERIRLISTDRGFYKYDGMLVQLDKYSSQYESFQHFYRDSGGRLWMLKNNGNAFLLKEDEVVRAGGIENLSDYHFNRIMEDREGNIWLTTARNGIVRVSHAQAKVIGKREGLSGNNILGLFEDSRGRFWVGTRDGGLNIIDGDQVAHIYEEEGISSNIIQTIAEDKEGNIWVGYYQEGIDKITDNNITRYNLGFGARINDVRAVHVSADSAIWLGTYGGLVKFDPVDEDHIIYTTEDGLAGNLVRYIDEAPDGSLWIATADGGVSHFKDGSFQNYTKEDGLSSNNIRSVYVDEYDSGTVWVGTEVKGLNRIRGDDIDFLGIEHGLPDHIIHYISQDQKGWLWMSSNRGVFKIKKEELNQFLDEKAANFKMVHYGQAEGMRNPECNGSFQQGGLRTSNATFWFSTQEGVAIFDVDPVSQNRVAPPVVLKDISAAGEHYSTRKADFESGVDDFQINFHAITFVSPEKTTFRYKLEGYNNEWKEVVGDRVVTYNDVPPGDYTFQVLAANNNGVWSPEPATAAIRVTPLFYQRWWFYLLLFVIVMAGYYGFSRARYRYLMKRQEKMQVVIDEQTAILRQEKEAVKEQNKIIEKQAQKLEESNQAKDRFFSIIGHDLRNPFQALVGYSSMILDSYETMNKDEVKDSLKEVQKASERLLNLVSSLLSWSSLQTEKVKPKPEKLPLHELIKKNVTLLSQSAQQKDIALKIEENESQQLYADRNMIDTILRNLISNAIKFTERGGEVTVKSYSKNDISCIEVSDTGIGMPPELVDKLMRLDKNTSRFGTENEAGSGLGLVICNDMVRLHNGSIEVESEEGNGTTFIVSIPEENFRENS